MEKTLVILDPELKDGFTPIPNNVLMARGLSLDAKGLYMVLTIFFNSDGTCPGWHELAKVTGFSEKKINRLLQELRRKGYFPTFSPRCVSEVQQQSLIREALVHHSVNTFPNHLP